ncbi:histidine kinase [Azospirillum sp. TSH58]|uniref:sensor histidine kinase n=1 Tax=Azospirillum sp. TSH58 TaxID=664962 RepID=UPI000D602E70|nr:ATP-binding protein [Azospirillum sp. TSH58]AWJ84148.1 histidine kinase [Azospirillum sp. TSH58]PWC60702.1 histidine kinase [Azospirillum sp. TSH58]
MLDPDPTSPAPGGTPETEAAPVLTAALLAVREPSIGPDAPCRALRDRLTAQPGLPALAVTAEDGRVLGLVDRLALAGLADPEAPARMAMDRDALLVEADLPLCEVARRIMQDKPGALASGFVVLEKGRYLGIGSGVALLARTDEQIIQRTRQLDEARRAAERANRAKTAFFACMSHEIRTPLNAMMGFAELLEQEVLGPIANPLYRDYARDIAESGRYLMDLINDLLDLSKAEAGRLELTEALVDVPRVAVGSVRLLSDRAGRAGVGIDTALPPDLPPLRADERKLRQMLLNLLSNAVKFTPPDGVVTLNGRVAADGSLCLSVHDTGIGMTADELEKALEPWGQIDSALGRNHIGTGLGLPLTKRLVELHGGRLDIDTAPDRGTTMTLVFPAERVGG